MIEWMTRDELKDQQLASDDHGFPLRVTGHFFRQAMQSATPEKLIHQVLPHEAEGKEVKGFQKDPLFEKDVIKDTAFLQKYEGRILMVANNACAAHCRYCFRRHFPYNEHGLSLEDTKNIFAKLKDEVNVDELILSGGDPLMLSKKKWKHLIRLCAELPWLKRLRIHTRIPIFEPGLLTEAYTSPLNELKNRGIKVITVIHANHKDELSKETGEVVLKLKNLGEVLNQSVLLKGVNDSVEDLKALSEGLLEIGVIPYYLHQLDKVAGAAHFYVDKEKGKELIRELRKVLPGYLVPRFVIEEPGMPNKTMIA